MTAFWKANSRKMKKREKKRNVPGSTRTLRTSIRSYVCFGYSGIEWCCVGRHAWRNVCERFSCLSFVLIRELSSFLFFSVLHFFVAFFDLTALFPISSLACKTFVFSCAGVTRLREGQRLLVRSVFPRGYFLALAALSFSFFFFEVGVPHKRLTCLGQIL